MLHDIFAIEINGKMQGGWMVLNITVAASPSLLPEHTAADADPATDL